MSDRWQNSRTPRHKRPAIVASFVVLLVLSSVAFAVTAAGYVATEKQNGDVIVGTVTDYRLDDSTDPSTVVVEIEVENPTMRPVNLESANVDGVVNGSTVARASTVLDTRVPADGSETITLRLEPRDDPRTVVEAAESGSLTASGILWGSIEQKQITITVNEADRSTGGEGA